jgi:hypothetical protein
MSTMGRQVLAAVMALSAVAFWETAAVAEPGTGKTVHAVTASTSRPLCKHGYRLRGSHSRGFRCIRGHRSTRPRCQSNYQLHVSWRSGKRFRCLPAPRHSPASTPLTINGSITNVHGISGKTFQATYTINASGCAGASCYVYAHAFQVPASQVCAYGNGHHWWTFKGTSHYVPYTETSTVNFTQVPSGSIRLCLFVEAVVGSARTQYLVAEATVSATHTRPETPLTVHNICFFNPGLGAVKYFGTLVWWDSNGDGLPDFGAYNFEGDSSVDVAFVMRGSKVAWVAFCYPRESAWINVPQYEREQHQSLTLTPQAWRQLSVILQNNANLALPWVDPTPSVGSIWVNGEGECGATALYCQRIS